MPCCSRTSYSAIQYTPWLASPPYRFGTPLTIPPSVARLLSSSRIPVPDSGPDPAAPPHSGSHCPRRYLRRWDFRSSGQDRPLPPSAPSLSAACDSALPFSTARKWTSYALPCHTPPVWIQTRARLGLRKATDSPTGARRAFFKATRHP